MKRKTVSWKADLLVEIGAVSFEATMSDILILFLKNLDCEILRNFYNF